MNLHDRKAFQTGVIAGKQIAKDHPWKADDFLVYGADKHIEKQALNLFLKEVSEGFIVGFREQVKVARKNAIMKRTSESETPKIPVCPHCHEEMKDLDYYLGDFDVTCPACKRLIPLADLLEGK